MNSKLNRLFISLEEDRVRLLTSLRGISTDKLLQAPEGKWSIQQILAHLIAAEKLSIMYLRKKMLGIKEENTPVYASFEELTADWDKTRAELKVLLEKFDDTQITKKIYKHIIAGRLNIQHALLFFREHIIHHTPQINRLLKL
jgi:uncharacterized damage-inducible protein DinB